MLAVFLMGLVPLIADCAPKALEPEGPSINDAHRLGGGERWGRLDGNVKKVIPPMERVWTREEGGGSEMGGKFWMSFMDGPWVGLPFISLSARRRSRHSPRVRYTATAPSTTSIPPMSESDSTKCNTLSCVSRYYRLLNAKDIVNETFLPLLLTCNPTARQHKVSEFGFGFNSFQWYPEFVKFIPTLSEAVDSMNVSIRSMNDLIVLFNATFQPKVAVETDRS